jgi:hypothetical protein
LSDLVGLFLTKKFTSAPEFISREILTFFAGCSHLLNQTSLRHLAINAQAMLVLSGRVTIKGLSRWTQGRASYRTLQRFYAKSVPWLALSVKFFETHLFEAETEYMIGGDTTTITKAGKETHGLDRFFSGVLGQVVKGLEFKVFSLISVKKKVSILLDETASVSNEFEKILQRFAPDYLPWKPESWEGIPSEEFSAIEQICHLRDIEIVGYQVRLQQVASENNPVLVSIDGYELAENRKYHQQNLDDVLDEFRQARLQTIELIKSFSENDFTQKGFFEDYGEVNLRSLIFYLRSHDL